MVPCSHAGHRAPGTPGRRPHAWVCRRGAAAATPTFSEPYPTRETRAFSSAIASQVLASCRELWTGPRGSGFCKRCEDRDISSSEFCPHGHRKCLKDEVGVEVSRGLCVCVRALISFQTRNSFSLFVSS